MQYDTQLPKLCTGGLIMNIIIGIGSTAMGIMVLLWSAHGGIMRHSLYL